MVDKYMDRFDAFEMHPVREGVGKDGSRYYDQCEEDDPELKYWSVYGHHKHEGDYFPKGGLECLADCPTKEIALTVKEALEKSLHVICPWCQKPLKYNYQYNPGCDEWTCEHCNRVLHVQDLEEDEE